ncbi:MAG: 1-acyl-sn-glycerol-3-phosphate acyltransferase [Deltaproteobacteria bacterium]|nr:1-acyl-sn-glycerol-3-phosphate acyltransferase [Deltaproteobacteria bacterium]
MPTAHRPVRPKGSAADWPLAVSRWLVQSAAFWSFNAAFLPLLLVVLATARGEVRRTRATALVRWWGRTTLRIFRVRLAVDAATMAELQRRRRRVLTFNHSSTLDICLMTALWPAACAAVVKREMLHLPLMGQAIAMLDFVPLDRRNPALAQASLQAAAERMRREDLTVMISPEGTRSPTGALQPFKLGAFHLAAQADAPILPLVLHGVPAVWPRSQWYARPGTVTAQLLPERPAVDAAADAQVVHAQAEELHHAYLAALQTSTAR